MLMFKPLKFMMLTNLPHDKFLLVFLLQNSDTLQQVVEDLFNQTHLFYQRLVHVFIHVFGFPHNLSKLTAEKGENLIMMSFCSNLRLVIKPPEKLLFNRSKLICFTGASLKTNWQGVKLLSITFKRTAKKLLFNKLPLVSILTKKNHLTKVV